MKSLIVSNTHKNRGEVVNLDFTDRAHYYKDQKDRLYTLNDFVDINSLDHEQAKANVMLDYWALVYSTILEHKRKEVASEQRASNFGTDADNSNILSRILER